MLNGFTAEHDDKRFSPVGIDIGNRMAESLDQLGFTFLYHGTPLCMIFEISVFLFCFFAGCKCKFYARATFLSVMP